MTSTSSGAEQPFRRKLIEIDLPLDAINAGIGAGEVHPPRTPFHPTLVVGTPARWLPAEQLYSEAWWMTLPHAQRTFRHRENKLRSAKNSTISSGGWSDGKVQTRPIRRTSNFWRKPVGRSPAP